MNAWSRPGALVISAHALCATRLCQADQCTRDAAHNADLCEWCARQGRPPAAPPERIAAVLPCTKCGVVKPDEDFSPATGRPKRRDRHHQCKACHAERTRVAYARNRAIPA